MKHIFIAIVLLLSIPTVLVSQTSATSNEEALTPGAFLDSMKVFWDEVKKDADAFAAAKGSKGEFETSAEFQTRLQKNRFDTQRTIENFLSAGHYADRTYSVLAKATLVHYNADAQLYTVTISTPIAIPPDQHNISTECAPNQYFAVTDSMKRGYKFSYLTFKNKDGFLWHIDESTARLVKSSEQNIYFRVSLRFDFSQVFANGKALITIIPTKFELVNKADNLILWSNITLR
jgi:hypothetical protein